MILPKKYVGNEDKNTRRFVSYPGHLFPLADISQLQKKTVELQLNSPGFPVHPLYESGLQAPKSIYSFLLSVTSEITYLQLLCCSSCRLLSLLVCLLSWAHCKKASNARAPARFVGLKAFPPSVSAKPQPWKLQLVLLLHPLRGHVPSVTQREDNSRRRNKTSAKAPKCC